MDQKAGDGARGKEALPMHRPLAEDVEEAEEPLIPLQHGRDPISQRGWRGRSASLGIETSRRGVGSIKPYHGLERQTNDRKGGGKHLSRGMNPLRMRLGRTGVKIRRLRVRQLWKKEEGRWIKGNEKERARKEVVGIRVA